MKSQLIVIFLMLIAAFAIFQCVQGLQCHKCVYYEGISDEDVGIKPRLKKRFFDESCKKGSTPKAKFAQKCRRGQVCSTGEIDGHSSSNHTKIEIYSRGCVTSLAVKIVGKMGCNEFKSVNAFLTKVLGRWRKHFPIERKLSPDTKVNICFCKQNCAYDPLGLLANSV